MENVWVLAALWVGLALIATLVAIWFRISTALSEIVIATVVQRIIGDFFVHGELGAKTPWVTFLAGIGAIVVTSRRCISTFGCREDLHVDEFAQLES